MGRAARLRAHCLALAALLVLALSPASAQERPGGADPQSGTPIYTLQRGDVLDIKVFNVPELAETVTVRPDGRISVLLLDDLAVEGMTTAQLHDILTKRYAEFYRDPRVTINVKTFANLKVYVGGEVTQPGMIALVGELTAARAVLQAGGLKGTAKPENAILLRDSGTNTPLAIRVDLQEAFRNGKADVALKPFDVVFIPKSRIAKVNEWVTHYIRQVLPITLTGGFTYLFNNAFPGIER